MMVTAMALPMILRAVFQMLMGHTPGHLSRATMVCSQQKLISQLGYMKQVLSHLATAVRLSHSSEEADLNEIQSRFHAAASRPDGPAAPSILRTVLCISWPSICSKVMEWGSLAGVFGFTIVSFFRVDSTTPVICTLFNVPDIIMNVNREH